MIIPADSIAGVDNLLLGRQLSVIFSPILALTQVMRSEG